MRTRKLISLAALLVFGANCGSTHNVGVIDAGGSHDGAAVDASTSACPANAPTAGSACENEDFLCAYGNDPRWNCRDRYRCTAGSWIAESLASECSELPPATCPSSRADAAGQACTPEGAYCAYDGLACHCTTCPNPYPLCMPLAAPIWACDAPNADDSCPAAIPNAGTACSSEALRCSYGCERNRDRICQSGLWIEASSEGGCPISTRRAKHDIAYLSPAEVDALAHEATQMPLATYEYNDPALAGRRRLGFIIEDAPMSYAVDPERSQVDLYGYTSVLLATLQSQARRIDALEAQVRTLAHSRRHAH